jgi:hypothetical protein
MKFSHVLKVALAAGALAVLAIVLATRSPQPEPADLANGAAAVLPLTGHRPWDQVDNAATDGWSTEVFSGLAEQQLERLGTLLESVNRTDSGQIASLISDEFACSDLLPGDLETVFEDELFTVQRISSAQPPERRQPIDESALRQVDAHRNAHGLAEALRLLAGTFEGAESRRFKSKLFQVRRSGRSFLTRQYISFSGRLPDGILEQHATWIARWVPSTADDLPRLSHLALEAFEQVKSSGGPLFTDCTESVLGGNDSYRKQMLHGVNHWLARSQNHIPNASDGRAGIAIGDVNGDGLDDLYVCQDAGLPNRLYVQQADGTALDLSASSSADWLESSHGALLADLDGDGDQDLAVALEGAVMVAENDGNGRFETRSVVPVSDNTMSLSAADFDGDADLDLYVCAYKRNTLSRESGEGIILPTGPGLFLYYDANNGAANSLLRNDGNWQFDDCTEEVGVDRNNTRMSYASAWEDYDDDGDPDLYVANDFGRNNLYRNDGGTFTDVAAEANAEDSASGMSVSWADYDRDGDMDLYVANMFSAAGNRILDQEKFDPVLADGVRDTYRRFARGNTLMRNLGTGRFEDVSVDAGVTLGRWAWSSNFADLNNDGWEDLVVLNGFYTSELPESGDL